jgi:signal transduction histidine kinase
MADLRARAREVLARNRRVGLVTRIIAALTLLAVAFILLISIVVVKITETNLYSQKENEGALIVNSFNAEATVLHMADADPPRVLAASRVPTLARRLADGLGLLDYVLLDERFQAIAARDEARIGRSLDDPDVREAFHTARLRSRYVLDPRDGEPHQIVFTGPVLFGGRVSGIFRFALPLGDVTQMINLTRRLLLFYIVLDTLAIVVLGSFLLSRMLVRPLQDLVATAERIGQGNFDVPIPRGRTDEIGRLTDAFRAMVEGLKKAREQERRQMRAVQRVNEELERAQREVLSTDRLAYVGRVAAGVAHEVGNPLAAILGYLEILRERDGVDEAAHQDYVTRIEGEARRIDDIIRSLLDFAKPSGEGVSAVDAGEIADGAAAIVTKQRAMDRVAIVRETDPDLPPVRADGKLLLQVLVNLLINARDAMPGGGRIVVRTSTTAFDRLAESLPTLTELRPDDPQSLTEVLRRSIRFSGKIPFPEGSAVVKMAVHDDGEGIAEEHLSSIFAPFFTTKTPKKGTGLGLAICQRIVEEIGGVVKAESRPGKGTVFTIYLPAAPPAAETAERAG